MFRCNEYVEMNKFLRSLACIWMTIIDSQFYIIDSLSLDVSLEWNANLVVAWLQRQLVILVNQIYVDISLFQLPDNDLLGAVQLTDGNYNITWRQKHVLQLEKYQLRQIVHVRTCIFNKVMKLKLQCFYTCICTSCMWNDIIFGFIDS